jgi:hypothetical protein
MKFLMTYEQATQDAPTPEKMAAIGAFTQEMSKSGVLLMTGGLQRATQGTRVELAGAAFTVTDGPFAETKELIDGFALVEVTRSLASLRFATTTFSRAPGRISWRSSVVSRRLARSSSVRRRSPRTRGREPACSKGRRRAPDGLVRAPFRHELEAC